ncbi:MAG TPA: RNA-binding cell elongation regulator Jag/EloR [Desulfomonilaceae bacterium]|nr:RNA-binding cell elongation regulator Jag/EloR [Desulfomonilaceae bacterium]
MSFYEFTGKSVKEAIAKACEELNVEEALLDVEVLEESTRGFLGIVGQRDARVRVRKRNILTAVAEAQEPEPGQQENRLIQSFEEQESEEDFVQAPESPEEVRETMEPIEIADEVVAQVREILQNIIRKIPVDAEVEASVASGAVYLEIKGDGSGLLIGKKGQTLDALQYMVNKIINRENAPGEKIEVVVDTENYRLRKKESLTEMALKMSHKAKKTLKPVSFNPMPPHERRIIHMILAEDKEVYTKSYGEGPMRRIIVYPRRGMGSKRRRR